MVKLAMKNESQVLALNYHIFQLGQFQWKGYVKHLQFLSSPNRQQILLFKTEHISPRTAIHCDLRSPLPFIVLTLTFLQTC